MAMQLEINPKGHWFKSSRLNQILQCIIRGCSLDSARLRSVVVIGGHADKGVFV